MTRNIPMIKKIILTKYKLLYFLLTVVLLSACNNYFKNDFIDNSPTSGKLNVYYDEGLQLHLENQIYTFEAHYPSAKIYAFQTTESKAVEALYNDSCKAIVLSRLLSQNEIKTFEQKKMATHYTAVAQSGVALITNAKTDLDSLTYEQVIELLTKPFVCKDSISNETKLNVLFDKNNSAVVHYLKDSLLKGAAFSGNCNILNGSIDAVNFVAQHKNTIAFIDFAWLSDVDDSITKANKGKLKFISVSKQGSKAFMYPNQSSFKLNSYPFTRTIYVIRNTGDFTLAKGFESFVAGPKGQNSFLKQGLLPTKQQERMIKVNMGN
jgi:phosphate transport system substrate-binding protein